MPDRRMSTGRRPEPRSRVLLAIVSLVVSLTAIAIWHAPAGAAAGSSCGPTINVIACENQQPGTPDDVWDITGSGDPTIQGFSTDISVNAGNTVSFKINTNARAYTIDIYRLGYYNGDGARHIASVTPSASLPQTQPACATDPSTSLYDCGTWAVSASWAVPSTAVSGVYLADLKRTDTGGMSQITFIVRNDASTADIVYQTSDETWEAYNRYGGSNFYTGDQQNLWDSPSRARQLSYNRPFATRGDNAGRDFVFSNEYPTIRFLEQNGYDVTYISGVDTDRYGATLLTHHKVFLSVGHDEYWSQAQRTNVTNARDAGVNLMFLSGNEVYWHTRFAPSIDGSSTPYRTLIDYKETWDNAPTDPSGESTATWRDPRFDNAPGGANPENALTGTMYKANSDDLPVSVTKAQGKLRIWRNTTLGSMTAASTDLAAHTVGYESDEDVDNGFRPAGLIDMSTTVGTTPQELLDFGVNVATGTTTHHITLYRAPSGALVFGAGTIQWAWGLDINHDGDGAPADSRMQQATVNMLADMSAQPTTLMSGLVRSTASSDTAAPTSTITSPTSGMNIANGTSLTVSGTAADTGGGVVAGVEVSLDGGATWHPAAGTTSWSYTGIVHGQGAVKIESRATDDSANVQSSPTIANTNLSCPCSLFGNQVPGTTPDVGAGTTSPVQVDSGDGGAWELGMAFSSTIDGVVTGVRFYKSAANTGTHVGTLWTASGTALATGTFTNETASGWQTLKFSAPVSITKNTKYVVSYWAPNGHYTDQPNFYYYGPTVASPLQAYANTPGNLSTNGLFGTTHGFPTSSYIGTNYYVDVLFSDAASAPPTVTAQTPASGATGVATSVSPSVTFSKPITASTISYTMADDAGHAVTGAVTYNSGTNTATFNPTNSLAPGTGYTVTINATDTAGQPMSAPYSWSFSTAFPANSCPCVLLGDAWTPDTASSSDTGAVELGMKFTTDTDGVITGVRFYKGLQNGGTHTGELWSSTGALLARATFANESATGWQTAMFTTPVSVTAGTTYVVSYYAPSGGFAMSLGAMATATNNFPLHVPANGSLYSYGAASSFPTSTSTTNYGVDAIFSVPASVVPSVTATKPTSGSAHVPLTSSISATFSTSIASGSASFTVTDPGGTTVPGTTSLNATHTVLTFTPTNQWTLATKYTATVSGARSLGGTAQSSDAVWSFTASAGGTSDCPCTLFQPGTTPANTDSGDTSAVNLGVQFTPSVSGFVSGAMFYKSAANTGTHVATLWTAGGTQLARATFTGETGSGWQSVTFGSPVAVTAGTTYVVSYFAPNGHYAFDPGYFSAPVTNGPLTAPANVNGLYAYSSGSAFPSGSYNATNYWVDVVFAGDGTDITPPTVTSSTPTNGASNVSAATAPTATFSEPINTSSLVFTVSDAAHNAVPGTVTYDSASATATFTPTASLTAGGTYTVSVKASDTAGNAMPSAVTWNFTVTGSCPCTLFPTNAVPAQVTVGDPSSINLGVQFTPSTDGFITGMRFYKGPSNTGTHIGTLWSASGTALATVTFSGESASGWQSATLGTPVAVTAGTTYVVSYNAPNGNYSIDANFFSAPYTNGPLGAPVGAGVYAYGPSGTFPTSSYQNTNYWIDPVFATSVAPADTTPPVISAVTATPSGSTLTVTWTTDEPATSRVDYDTSAAALNQNATTSGLSTSHSVVLSPIAPNTRYYYRVTSADAAGNSATSPAGPGAPANWAPSTTPLADSLVADFAAGSVGSPATCYVAANGDGEVVLVPTAVAEFNGTALPAGWTATNGTGGSAVVTGGSAIVTNSTLTTTATYTSGKSLETLATLGKNQTIGWVSSSSGSLKFSFTVNTSNQLIANVNDGFTTNVTSTLATGWTVAPHTFRVEVNSNSVAFYLDGVQKFTRSITLLVSNLRPSFGDTVTTDGGLGVDWVRVGPYGSSGTFTSRVFDGRAQVGWDALVYDATVPTGATLVVSVRTGNTATPDGTWSAYATVASGASINKSARYVQYQLAFTSTGTRYASAAVRSVTANFHVL